MPRPSPRLLGILATRPNSCPFCRLRSNVAVNNEEALFHGTDLVAAQCNKLSLPLPEGHVNVGETLKGQAVSQHVLHLPL